MSVDGHDMLLICTASLVRLCARVHTCGRNVCISHVSVTFVQVLPTKTSIVDFPPPYQNLPKVWCLHACVCQRMLYFAGVDI
jgi:hypothetical protein